jgi:hypothetical protein
MNDPDHGDYLRDCQKDDDLALSGAKQHAKPCAIDKGNPCYGCALEAHLDGPDDVKPARVTPEYIVAQRELGWPDIHPEDYCHICGSSNPLWVTDRATWLTATAQWATETGREGICCPSCFARMHATATGDAVIWTLSTPPTSEQSK